VICNQQTRRSCNIGHCTNSQENAIKKPIPNLSTRDKTFENKELSIVSIFLALSK
jgi:hypothetical protein